MPYTEERCRICTSFNNAGGGHVFIHWLRNELMKSLDYYSEQSIYVDNVASRSKGKTSHSSEYSHGGHRDSIKASGGTPVNPFYSPNDGTRNFAQVQGHGHVAAPEGQTILIGAENNSWDKWWEEAFKESKVLIQVRTALYGGAAVDKEVDMINKAGANAPYVVFLTFNNENPRKPINLMGRCKELRCTKEPYYMGTTLTGTPEEIIKGSWKISNSNYGELLKVLRKQGC